MTDLYLFFMAIFVVVVAAGAYGRALGVTLGASLLPAAATVLLIHYGAALAGVLPWALALSFATAVGAGIVALRTSRGGEASLAARVDPSAVLAMLLAGWAWWLFLDQRYLYWDEFSHWGLLSKAIHGLDRLPRPGESVELLDYPPGSALFQYFVLQLGSFTEGRSYAAQAWFVFCAWAAVVHRATWRQSVIAAVGFATACLLASTLTAGLPSLYVDLVLASVFGGGVALALTEPASAIRQLLLLAPVVAILPILKEVGWPLALLIATLVGASHFAELVTAPTERRWHQVARAGARGAALFLLLALAAHVTRTSWHRHLVVGNIPATFPVEPERSLLDLPGAFAAAATPRERLTVSRFREALTTRPVTDIERLPLLEATWRRLRDGHLGDLPGRAGPSTVTWTYLLFGMSVAAIAVQPTRTCRMRAACGVAVLTLGCAAYLAAHLYVYLYAFSELEGTALASFGRYVGIYMFGWGLVVIAILVQAATAVHSSRARHAGAILLLVLAAAGAAKLAPVEVTFLIDGQRSPSPERAALDPALQTILPYATAHERIYTVFQGSLGLEHRIARLEVSPAVTNSSCWSLGAWYRQPDQWTCEYPPERVALSWQTYTLLFLGHVDAKFWAQYGRLFPPGSERHRVFRIRATGGGLSLSPVDPPMN